MSILLDERSRVLVQGITGRQARVHTAYMKAYGTNVVAGISPGKGGQQVEGVPVFDSVEQAVRAAAPDVSALFVPAPRVRGAALEAVEANIPLVAILAEGVPHHDAALILRSARERGIRVVGPGSQGMISPGRAKLGGAGGEAPERMYRRGPVGILSRSGGMGGEIAAALTRRGIGQSTSVSLGGDLLIGTGFADLLPLFEADLETQAVVLFGEPGTGREENAAEMIAGGLFGKPVVTFVCGTSLEGLPRGMSFGHTSGIMERGTGLPSRKKELLRAAGAFVADRFDEIPSLVEEALAQGSRARTFRTERLLLRPFAPRDEQALLALWNDPEVRRFLWDDQPVSPETVHEQIAISIRDFETRGYGQFLLAPIAAPEIAIGFAGLRFVPDLEAVEILYALLPAYWGRGLATEAARAVLGFGFLEAGLDTIYAGADPPNAASFRVMERLGMVFFREIVIQDRRARYYRLRRDDFRAEP